MMVITLDGPCASGKSTLAKGLAKQLGFYYLSTGILYRGVAYCIFHRLFTPFYKVASLTQNDLSFIHHFSYIYEQEAPRLFYQGEDITPFLFSPERDQEASIISANPFVREALLSLQRTFAQKYNLIAEGRDCGSFIFPNAQHKFYVTASLEVRAQRKIKEYNRSLDETKKELEERDRRDMSRKNAPLIIPKNAIVIDTSKLTIEQSLATIVMYIEQSFM
jgi:cytidylate kinase